MLRKACGLAAVVFCLAASAQAGLTFRQVVRSEGGPGAGGANMESQVWLEGDAMKIEFTGMPENPMFGRGSYMLMKGDEVFIVNPEKQTYTRLDLEQLSGMMSSMTQAMGGMGVEMRVERPRFEKLLEEAGPAIQGYPTQHYRYHTSYTMVMEMPVGGSMTNSSDTIDDVWTTTAIEVPIDSQAFEAFAGAAPLPELRELTEAERAKMTGFPLKRVMVSKNESGGTGMMARMMKMGGGGGGGETTTTFEVVDIREQAIPASTFEIPAGYSEVEMMQQGPAMPDLEGMEN